jgi:two-component system, chemotaxis family, CheB/CheR fusion protein
MNPLLQKKILTTFSFCLNAGGILFLGPSESLGELKTAFLEIDKKWKIFKNITVTRHMTDNTYTAPSFNTKRRASPTPKPEKNIRQISNPIEIINQTLLLASGYDGGICVDQDFKITQSYGNFEKYLLPKIFNFNMLEMLPEELAMAASTTIRKATSQNKHEIIKEVKFRKNETVFSVTMLVKPFLSEDNPALNTIVVLFREEETKKIEKKDFEIFDKEFHAKRFMNDLKNEFSETKQRLNDCESALEASNNDISSYNEELISSNEELQSTNEELQSLNEELQTVNNEYQLKIRELADLNDDLNNYFKGTINGQLYVDNNLIVRKFTPSAIKQINLKESDIGRPLSDISTNIKFETIIGDITEVILTSITSHKEIQTTDGRWYQMMIIPYIKQQNSIKNGAIITFNEITELKLVQDKLIKINAEHDTFIYSVSHDLKAPLANIGGLVSGLHEIVGPSSKEVKETIDLVDLSIVKLKETINELSDITKIEYETVENVENVNLSKLLEEVQLSINDILSESNAKIHFDLKETEIPFPKKNLRSVLLNLLTNCIKYRQPERDLEITIKTEKLKDYIVLSIRDNGIGIEKDKTGKIFSLFKRVNTGVDGSGVGLYLIKKMITNAGGKIEVESEPGKGSTFKVYFKIKS